MPAAAEVTRATTLRDRRAGRTSTTTDVAPSGRGPVAAKAGTLAAPTALANPINTAPTLTPTGPLPTVGPLPTIGPLPTTPLPTVSPAPITPMVPKVALPPLTAPILPSNTLLK